MVTSYLWWWMWWTTHWTNAGLMLSHRLQDCLNIKPSLGKRLVFFVVSPANTRHWPNVVLMLVHRVRRWPNIKTTLSQCLVFAGNKCETLAPCCFNVGPASLRCPNIKTTLVDISWFYRILSHLACYHPALWQWQWQCQCRWRWHAPHTPSLPWQSGVTAALWC